jgi:hypothetical protein
MLRTLDIVALGVGFWLLLVIHDMLEKLPLSPIVFHGAHLFAFVCFIGYTSYRLIQLSRRAGK